MICLLVISVSDNSYYHHHNSISACFLIFNIVKDVNTIKQVTNKFIFVRSQFESVN